MVPFWLPLAAENKDKIGFVCGSSDGARVGLNLFNGILVGNSSSSKLDTVGAKLGNGVGAAGCGCERGCGEILLSNLVLNDSKLELASGSSFEDKANGSGGGRGGVGGGGAGGAGGAVGIVGDCLLSGRKVARSGCQTKFEFEDIESIKRVRSSDGLPKRPSIPPVVESNLIWPATRPRSLLIDVSIVR